MQELLISISYIVGALLIPVALVYLLVSVPCFAYYLIRMASSVEDGATQDWKSLWKWNRANLLLFSARLNDVGRSHQEKAAKWLLRGLFGAFVGLLAFVLTGQFSG